MITFTIIEDLNIKAPVYKIGASEGNSVWLADDAVIVAKSPDEFLEILEILKTETGKNSLLFQNRLK